MKTGFLKETKGKNHCRIVAFLLAVIIVSQQICTNSAFFSVTGQAAITMPIGGVIIADTIKVKKKVGGKSNLKDENGTVIVLKEGHDVTIEKKVSIEEANWYQITFEYGEHSYQGYVRKKKVSIVSAPKANKNSTLNDGKIEQDQKENDQEKEEDIEETTTEDDTTEDKTMIEGDTTSSGEALGTETETQEEPVKILNEEEFEAAMAEQGFPESYLPYLRELHNLHPTWSFESYQTGLDWETVIKKQSKVGRNLVPSSKGVAWKSTAKGAYNWTKDTFTIFDGKTWVSASKKAIRYYMDPRNFLNEEGIYQFELLSYHSACQKKAGVATILNNTPMADKEYTYTDPDSGNTAKITYVDTFLKAAELSNVSPYHLASRVRQEVVTSATSFSNSANGTYSGYEGYYNFYNIGASDSAGGGAIAKGLTYAKKTDSTYLLPWTSPYRSIIGGALYIGKSYINKGQNTLYLEKFNVTPISTYNHQYMTNVEAAYSESLRIQTAYSELGESPLIFSIPVYDNMPETVCAKPKKGKNPNNWLKSLSITGYSLTPTFQAEEEEDTVYNLIVDNSVESIEINAESVSTLASISGIGEIELEEGENTCIVQVTAENGKIKEYTINIVREEEIE